MEEEEMEKEGRRAIMGAGTGTEKLAGEGRAEVREQRRGVSRKGSCLGPVVDSRRLKGLGGDNIQLRVVRLFVSVHVCPFPSPDSLRGWRW